jgi:signal transduction histidine kinase/ActR/RegA family two-component response regulator
MKAPILDNETARLRALQLYQILDSLPEKAFDEITQLAAHICKCPIATVSIIAENRQWYKSKVGIDAVETPRDTAFCSHTINQRELLVVPDTSKDTRFCGNPNVMSGPKVRFYAGAPLINKEGFGLGALCVVDLQPRELDAAQLEALEALSRHVVILLELRRAEREVQTLNNELEKRVAERTEQLIESNELLLAEIEERKRIEHQMVQIQKMEAIGRLAGGVAHDFNNLLQVVSGYCDILLDQADLKPMNRKSIQEIQKSGKRGAALVGQLLTFSRKQVVEPRQLELNEIVQGMTTMLQRLIGDQVRFVITQGHNLHPIQADLNQIEQIIMNLVINAADAMNNNGHLRLETSSIVLEQPLPYHGGEIEPNRYTVLTVADSGTGMSDEVKAKIFEPFFTTKPIGKGTGLGLATCFGIVQQSRGYIRCESKLGRGTTFDVFLPASETNILVHKTGRLSTVSRPGHETILVVEDDNSVRQLTAETLRQLGYLVFEACDGLEALALVQSRSQLKIDLLLTDLVMPNMNGVELLLRLNVLRPEIKCLIVSGYTEDVLMQHGLTGCAAPLLLKPFTNQQLSEHVHAALEQVSA